MKIELMKTFVFLAGIGHLVLSLGSLIIPKALNWKDHLKVLQPLLRQMFWTYAGYILAINASFGFVSILGADELLNKSFLAKSITLFISAYWLARIGIQFFYFDKTDAPKGLFYSLGEIALIGLFMAFTVIYAVAFLHNNSWI
jgi:hypothetical protein